MGRRSLSQAHPKESSIMSFSKIMFSQRQSEGIAGIVTFLAVRHCYGVTVVIGSDLSLQMRGYTKRVEQEDKPGDFTWLYSDRVLDLVHNYRMKFPELFRYWSDNGCQDPVLEDIYPDEAKPKLEEIKQYLTTLPTHKMSQHACGGDFLDEYIIQAIEDQLAFVKRIKKKEPTRFRTFIHPRLLYRVSRQK